MLEFTLYYHRPNRQTRQTRRGNGESDSGCLQEKTRPYILHLVAVAVLYNDNVITVLAISAMLTIVVHVHKQ